MARPLTPPPLVMARPLVEELFFAASFILKTSFSLCGDVYKCRTIFTEENCIFAIKAVYSMPLEITRAGAYAIQSE